MLSAIIQSMRPTQWTKNGVVLAGLIFSRHLLDWDLTIRALGATIVFCVLSGSVYLINDIRDLEKDRAHPTKRERPLPSGKLSVRNAWIAAIVLAAGSLMAAFRLDTGFCTSAAAYFALVSAYSFGLKNVVIIDAFTIALGFVLRAVAGVQAIALTGRVPISPWLLVCTFLLATFLALAKRRQELYSLKQAGSDAGAHRAVLSEYTLPLVDQLTAIVCASTIVAYALYTFDARTISTFGTPWLSVTIPFVMYGIFRYLYLVHRHHLGGNPEMILLNDRGILACVGLWIATAVTVIYGA